MKAVPVSDLRTLRRWVAWRNEPRGKKLTKRPYNPHTGELAKSDDPRTWGTVEQAQALSDRMINRAGGGIGFMLGDLGDGRAVGGLDFDTCRDDACNLAAWASEGLRRTATYSETSPSGTGFKSYFLYDPNDLTIWRALMGSGWGKMWKHPSGGDHPPGLELHLGNRYFAFTGERLDPSPAELVPLPHDTLRWIIETAGPSITAGATQKGATLAAAGTLDASALKGRIEAAAATNKGLARRWGGDWGGLEDQSRSGKAFALGAALKAAGFNRADIGTALAAHPETEEWVREKGHAGGGRELDRLFNNSTGQDPWGPPDMTVLRTGRRPPPPLPLGAFGPHWESWITTAARAAACPPDYVALPLLAAASALIGNARWAQATAGWAEPPHLWLGVVGDSGTSKSPGADCLLRDVLPEIERRMAGDFPDRSREWRAAAEAEKARADTWKDDVRTAAKTGNPPPMPPPSNLPPEPQAPRLRQNDVTVEKMASLLATAAPKGLLIVRDELAGWLMGMTAYNDAGRAFWIEAYGGRPYRVERQKHPEPITVHRLAVAVTGGTQPDKLAELFQDADDGLLARLCWAWPEPLPFRLGRETPEKGFAIESLDRLRLLELAPGLDDQPPVPIFVPLDQNAQSMIEAFGQDMQETQSEAGGLLRSAYGKARGLALRLSLVLTMLRWCAEQGMTAAPDTIDEDTLGAACDLVAGYFMPMAARVFGDAAAPIAERNAATLARWIIKERPFSVHVRTLQRETRLPGLHTADAIHAACAVLVEADWLRPPPRGEFQARAKVAYSINPALGEPGRG